MKNLMNLFYIVFIYKNYDNFFNNHVMSRFCQTPKEKSQPIGRKGRLASSLKGQGGWE